MSGIGKLIGEGRTAEIYEYGEGKVLKLFRLGYEHLADDEYNMHMHVQSLNVRVPRLFEMDRYEDRKGLVYQYLIGKSMEAVILESPSTTIHDMVAEMARLHIEVGRCKAGAELPSVKSRIANYIGSAADLTDTSKAKLYEWIDALPEGDGLYHGDFHPGNIIFSKDGPYIIDWLTASRGCFAADIARTIITIKYGVLSNNLPDEICALAATLCDLYLDQLVSMGAASYDQVEQWMPVQLAARLIDGNSKREQRVLLSDLDAYLI